jgi:hypothetical protein
MLPTSATLVALAITHTSSPFLSTRKLSLDILVHTPTLTCLPYQARGVPRENLIFEVNDPIFYESGSRCATRRFVRYAPCSPLQVAMGYGIWDMGYGIWDMGSPVAMPHVLLSRCDVP